MPLSRVSQCRHRPRTCLRFSSDPYQPSKRRYREENPRALAARSISQKWSCLVLPSAFLSTSQSTGILRSSSVRSRVIRLIPETTW